MPPGCNRQCDIPCTFPAAFWYTFRFFGLPQLKSGKKCVIIFAIQQEKEVLTVRDGKYITIMSGRTQLVLNVSTILYVLMMNKTAEIHVSGGKVYKTRMKIGDLEEALGDNFLKVHRGCLVSARAIHDITDQIDLNNGESLIYTLRKKKQIIAQFQEIQRRLIRSFAQDEAPPRRRSTRPITAASRPCPLPLRTSK